MSTEKITATSTGTPSASRRPRSDDVAYSLSTAPLDRSTVTLATVNASARGSSEFNVSKTTEASTNYKNHGEYVKSWLATRPTQRTRAS